MEIGDQAIHDLELITRIDKNTGPCAARLQNTVLIRSRLQRPAARRTDTDTTKLTPAFEVRLYTLYRQKQSRDIFKDHVLRKMGAKS